MKIVLMITFGLISFSCLCCFCHFSYQLFKTPQKLYHKFIFPNNGISPDKLPLAKKLYLSLVVIAVCIMTFTGTKSLLFFIPDSWGRVSDGEFITIKDTIASVVAFCSIASIDLVRKHLILVNELNNRS